MTAAKKSAPSKIATKTPKPSSTDRFRALGAEYTSSAPVFDVHKIVTPLDERHPFFGTARGLARYERHHPAMVSLMASIRKGTELASKTASEASLIQAPKASQIVGYADDFACTSDGGRRIVACRYLYEEDMEAGLQSSPYQYVKVTIKLGDSMASFAHSYRMANLEREDDDAVIRARKMAADLLGDDASGREPLGEELVSEQYRVTIPYLRKVTSPVTGLVALPDAIGCAVGEGEISEAVALEIAQVYKDADPTDMTLVDRQEVMGFVFDRIHVLKLKTLSAVKALVAYANKNQTEKAISAWKPEKVDDKAAAKSKVKPVAAAKIEAVIEAVKSEIHVEGLEILKLLLDPTHATHFMTAETKNKILVALGVVKATAAE